ncbi:MAG: hypothetical protein JJE25_03125, partial [Bacteroidia bacterium]|nr:hypothetical protein [Bacteroidia bacterium]
LQLSNPQTLPILSGCSTPDTSGSYITSLLYNLQLSNPLTLPISSGCSTPDTSGSYITVIFRERAKVLIFEKEHK